MCLTHYRQRGRCLENRTRLKKSIQSIRDFARSAIGAFKPSISVQDVEVSLSLAREGTSETERLRDALSLPQRLAERDGKRMIIAWDEFQDITRLDGRDSDETLKLIRAELQQQASVSHVFLGSQESLLRNILSGTSRAFYRFALEVPFPPAPEPAEWVPYLQQKYGTRDLSIAEPDARHLVDLAGGHPLDTMTVAAAAYYTAQDLDRTTIDSTVLELAFERAMLELSRGFDFLWTELGQRADARLVTRRLALGQPVTSGGSGRTLHQQQAQVVLGFLQNKGIVVRQGRGSYRFVEPMFAEYVRRLLA